MNRAEQLEALMPQLMRRMLSDAEDVTLLELPLAQLRILRILLDCPRPAGEVADLLGYSASGLSQLTKRLVRAGLLVKSKDAHDARVKQLTLSQKGKVLMENRRELRVQQASIALARLSEEEQLEFLRLLEKMSRISGHESWARPIERITA